MVSSDSGYRYPTVNDDVVVRPCRDVRHSRNIVKLLGYHRFHATAVSDLTVCTMPAQRRTQHQALVQSVVRPECCSPSASHALCNVGCSLPRPLQLYIYRITVTNPG